MSYLRNVIRPKTTMAQYLNQFHKESEERKLRKIQEWRKQPLNYERELKRQQEMHKRLAELYPEDNNKN